MELGGGVTVQGVWLWLVVTTITTLLRTLGLKRDTYPAYGAKSQGLWQTSRS
jgi:hypothetical protein